MTGLLLFDMKTTLFIFSWDTMEIWGMILESASPIEKHSLGYSVTIPAKIHSPG